MAWSDSSRVPVIERMLHELPLLGAEPIWAATILDSAVRLPSEHEDVIRRAAAAVLTMPQVGARARGWAEVLLLRTARPRDLTALAHACTRLAQEGNPVQAALGLSVVSGSARARGEPAVAELLYLASMWAADRAQGASPAPAIFKSAAVGTDRGAPAIAKAWAALAAGNSAELALVLETEALRLASDASQGKLRPLAEGLRASAQCVTGTCHNDGDHSWARGRALYGVAFAVPALGGERLRSYLAYAKARDVDLGVRAALTERLAQALMTIGQWTAALHELQAMNHEVRKADLPVAVATIARGITRTWRFAGDPRRALAESDALLDFLDHRWQYLPATAAGNVWLNRAYVLAELDQPLNAYEAAARALALFQPGHARIGIVEARGIMLTTDPDRKRAVALARSIIERDMADPLSAPVRTAQLQRAAQALAPYDRELAIQAFDRAIANAGHGRRYSVLVPLAAARALWGSRDPDDTSYRKAVEFARQAAVAAALQHNRLIGAQAKLFYARCLAADPPHHEEARAVGAAGLEDLGTALAGLNADGGQHVLTTVRPDLTALFDLEATHGNGLLALRIAEIGRSIRLIAMLRTNMEDLPEDLRELLADIAGSERAAHSDPEESADPGGEDNQAVRAAATTARTHASAALEHSYGRVFRAMNAAPPVDPAVVRRLFPRVHVLTLHELHGVVRWTWWPPHAKEPLCGRTELSAKVRRLIACYADGTVSTLPGSDVSTPLAALVPQELAEFLLTQPPDQPIDLLVAPTARMWSVPLLAIPIAATGAPLIRYAHVCVVPSLTMAVNIAENASATTNSRDCTVAGYFHPQMGGAQIELGYLERVWPTSPQRLDGIEELGVPADITVAATHADDQAGLHQSLRDHTGGRLSAARCLPRSFSPIVVLGACHGFNNTDVRLTDEEPIGLVTVLGARGATWVVGGHQSLHDLPIGWILGRTYAAMAKGENLHDALRTAQIAYLEAASKPSTAPSDLREILDALKQKQGQHEWRMPWSWALTIAGPPPAATWRIPAPSGHRRELSSDGSPQART
ncbi:CHAT domain-containing protein [Nocardia gipuzkoensis]